MNITWYGHNCFKLQNKDITLITDPFDKKIGLKPPIGGADIVTISQNHFGYNNSETIKNNPFIIDNAGEYEVKKTTIRGISSYYNDEKGQIKDSNIIYVIEIDDMKICHLGNFNQDTLSNKQIEEIGQIDILLIPVGGTFTIDWKKSSTIINQIEPRIIIPMHYKIKGITGDLTQMDTIDNFCKENSVSEKDALEKFNIKKNDLPQDEAKIILMKIS